MTLAIRRDIPYKNAWADDYEKARCRLDLYAPADATSALLWLHGGGLGEGDKSGDEAVIAARALAGEGVAVAAANYRLSGPAAYPAYLRDVAAAFAWLTAEMRRGGDETTRVFIGGHSAGAYLALMVGLDGSWLGEHGLTTGDIAGIVALSGQTVTHSAIRAERGLPAQAIIVDEAAPLRHIRTDAPPVLCLCAKDDLPMRSTENLLLVQGLRACGHTEDAFDTVSDRDHITILTAMAAPDDPIRRVVAAFLTDQTTGS